MRSLPCSRKVPLAFRMILRCWVCVLVCSGVTGCDPPAPPPHTRYGYPSIPADSLLADLDMLYRQMDSVHYDLYHHVPKERFDSLYAALRKGITGPMDAMGFYRHVLPLFNGIQDAHTLLVFPYDHVRRYGDQGGRFLPVPVDVHLGRVFAKRAWGDSVPAYAEIRAINEEPIADIVNELRRMANHERPESEEDYMAFLLPRILHAWYGADSTYTLDLRMPDMQERRVTLTGITLEQLKARSDDGRHFRFRDEGDGLAVLDIDRCEDKETFATFCDSVFTVLQQGKYRALVIDLRNNGGGSTAHGDTLLTYLTDRAFSQYPRVAIKYSRLSHPETDSTYTVTYNADLSRTVRNPKRFTGEVFVLVNEFTFSSAAVLAATVQCYGIGRIVGRETGGTQVFFDEPVVIQLPCSKLRALVSHQLRWCPCGDTMEHGILPDSDVPWRHEDHMNGVDAELQRVRELMHATQAPG